MWPTLNNTDRAMSRSQRGPLAATPVVSVPSNRFSKFDAQSFRVLLRRHLRDPAGMAANSTHLATTARDVQKQEFWGDVVFPLERAAAQVCREAGGRVSSNVLVRDMDLCSTSSTAAGSKWWRTDSLCGTDRSWRLTQRWSLHCTVMEQPDGLQQTTMGSHWSTHGGGKRPRTQNSHGIWVAPDWSSWLQRWEDVSPQKRRFS